LVVDGGTSIAPTIRWLDFSRQKKLQYGTQTQNMERAPIQGKHAFYANLLGKFVFVAVLVWRNQTQNTQFSAFL